MADPVTLTPLRAAGAIERDLLEAARYVGGTDALAIDAELVKRHILAVIQVLDTLHHMQLSIHAAQGAQKAANANGDGSSISELAS